MKRAIIDTIIVLPIVIALAIILVVMLALGYEAAQISLLIMKL